MLYVSFAKRFTPNIRCMHLIKSTLGRSYTTDNVSEQVVTPWHVHTDSESGVDYDKLIKQFGSQPVDRTLISRIETVTSMIDL